jgi:hypothetical protein
MAFSLFPNGVTIMANLLGIKYAPNLAFGLAIAILAIIVLQLTLWTSLLSARVIKVIQCLGLSSDISDRINLKEDLKKKEEE